LERISAELDVRGYNDHVQMLDSEHLDFVIIAAPHYAHSLITADAAARSVNVIKEKPFAVSASEARELADIAEANHVEIMIATQRRFDPIYTSFFHMAIPIGTPFFVDARYTMYITEPHAGWRGSRSQAGGGCIIDMGYHLIDLMTWYFGLPASVSATLSARAVEDQIYDAEDTASLLLTWSTGLHGSYVISRRMPPKTELFRVIGDNGIVEITPDSIRRLTSAGDVSEYLQHSCAPGVSASAYIAHFCQVLSGECQNISSPASHLPNMALIDACYKSADKGTTIDVLERVRV
jgi:predicted dehydrogenase